MNKPIHDVEAGEAQVTTSDATASPLDSLRDAAAALDEAMAMAHEAGDWHALRVLHSLSALLAATRH